MSRLNATAAFCLFLLTSCGGDSGGPSDGPPPVSLVLVSPGATNMLVGETEQLTVTLTDVNSNPLTRPVVWRSTDNSRATVTSTGLVTAHSPGPVTITATSEAKVGSASVVVTPVPVATVSVVPVSAALGLGTTSQLSAVPMDSIGQPLSGRPVTWSSDNEAAVTVSVTGLASAVGLGTAVITATSEGKTGTSTLTVNPIPVASVTVTPGTASVAVAATTTLIATTRDANGVVLPGRVVSWSSSDTTRAVVSATGVVTGVRKGSVTITASSEGQSNTAAVTVLPGAPVLVTVSPNPLVLSAGSTGQLTALVQDASGDTLNASVSWNSPNGAIATVSGTGLVTGVAEGTVIITATSGGIVGTDTVVVTPAPVASITISPAGGSVGVGATMQFSATPRDAQGQPLVRPVQWTSSDPALATISPSGLVTGMGVGPVLIIASSESVSDTVTLDVEFEAVAAVGVDPADVTIGAGLAVQLSAAVIGTSGDTLLNRQVTWASSAPGIATVDSNGLVTGHAAGSATITATSEGIDGTASITVQVILAFPALDGGYTHTCSLTPNGVTYCWGQNAEGQLGSGLAGGSSAVPIRVSGTVAFATLYPGGVHTCALTAAGAAWCWGSNHTGQLGIGDTLNSTVPVPVSGGLVFTQLSGGFAHVCGLTSGGDAYCWGSNNAGELGNGTTTKHLVPTLVSGGHQFSALSARGAHSCGLTTTGESYCWGKNTQGELGDGTRTNRSIPVLVQGGLTFSSITTGAQHTCGLTAVGAAWCWGDNSTGQVGDGTSTDRLTPVLVQGGVVFQLIKARGTHTCGIDGSGDGWCWGENHRGQLGDGTLVNRSSPMMVVGGYSFTDISSGADFSCGVASSILYCWGDNSSGQLGNGSFNDSSVPVKVLGQP